MASLHTARLLTPRSASPLLRRLDRAPLRPCLQLSSPFSTAHTLQEPYRPAAKRVRIQSPPRRLIATSRPISNQVSSSPAVPKAETDWAPPPSKEPPAWTPPTTPQENRGKIVSPARRAPLAAREKKLPAKEATTPTPPPAQQRENQASERSYPVSSGASSVEGASGNHTPEQDVDWTQSYHGIASGAFPADVVKVLRRPLDPKIVEIKPDGIIYLPEIKYRETLFDAFGPGGWGMVPRGPLVVGDKVVTREWALVVLGRFVAQAQGENTYFNKEQIPRASEAAKSNALMRCCKDLGIASELWDKKFIRIFKATQAKEHWVEHVLNKKVVKVWLRNGDKLEYPFRAAKQPA
ncbi:related to mitochondrial genome maintenance protein [Cephalotrichum gorgonifer]|uniref:Mitochondrial genome maintenance protein MGM101 n=1 Tax=Cephalotrichum gorgonifer TaxID=2041049 RepID=A0AAE8N846_9PEZI|nr:related to mitochondrial genome maintenance protein [Cephalotrichum gorgonifer]